MNNKLTLAAVVGTALIMVTCGQARADMYVNSVDVDQWIYSLQPASWDHMYDGSVTSPLCASLSIEAADVSENEAQVWLQDSYGQFHLLGFLDPDNSVTVFDLNPNWLDAMPVGAQIVGGDNYQVWVGTSTLVVSGPAGADVVFEFALGDLAARATFANSCGDLVVTFENLSTADVLGPSQVLTGVYFDIDGVTFTPLRAVLTSGSSVLFPEMSNTTDGLDSNDEVGGECAFRDDLTGVPSGASMVIASVGLNNQLGPADLFPGEALWGPPSDAPDGIGYGIVSAGYDPNNGNSQVTGDVPLIQNGVIFTLSASNSFNVAYIGGVMFNYGTGFSPRAVDRGDLVVTAVAVHGSPVAGRPLHVAWDVLNADPDKTVGVRFFDGVYLSSDTQWDIADIRLATVPHDDPVGPQQGYHAEADVVLPGVLPANYHILVRTDATNRIHEPDGEDNNVGVSDPIFIDVEELSVDVVVPGDFTDAERARYYRVTVVEWKDLAIRLDDLDDAGANEVYASFEAVPTRSRFDHRYTVNFAPDQTMIIPDTRAGTYYILTYASNVPGGGPSEFSIKAEYLPIQITSISPDHGGNAGLVTVTINGASFGPATELKLVRAEEAVVAKFVIARDGTQLTATFDLKGKTPGQYNLVVSNAQGQIATLANAFAIEAGRSPMLWAEIVGQQTVRSGWKSTYWIRCGNDGNMDAYGVVVWIEGLPQGTNYELGVELSRPFSWPEDIPFEAGDFPTELLLDGKMIIPIMVGRIAGGSSITVPLVVRAQSNWDLTVSVSDPLYGSQPSVEDVECYAELTREAIKLGFGVAPLGTCAELGLTVLEDSFEALIKVIAASAAGEFVAFNPLEVLGGWTLPTVRCLIEIGVIVAAPWAEIVWKVENGIVGVMTIVDLIQKCMDTLKRHWKGVLPVRVVRSWDPNAKLGPVGFGDSKFISPGKPALYMVCFENTINANAAASEVRVVDQLDGDLDWTTFELLEIGFGAHQILIPSGTPHYEDILEIDGWTWNATEGWHTGETPLIVDIQADIDIVTGQVTWDLVSYDPETGWPPEDPYAGFLPPNDPEGVEHRGEGYFMFLIGPKADLPTGTQITNVASIIFDANPPIETPATLNTIDNGAPSSRVLPLPASTTAPFTVEWTGQDDQSGSGIATYDVFVSADGGPFGLWLSTTDTVATMNGQVGHTYAFYSVATDNVGNREAPPQEADATTTVIVPNQPPVITCSGPVVLWSPSHDLVDASSAITVEDADGDSVSLSIRAFSNESEIPETGDGTGRHAPDFKNEHDGGRGLLVRAERRGAEDGRCYVFVVTADDNNGGVATAVCVAAVVPHDQNNESLEDVSAQAAGAASTIQAAIDAGDPLPPLGLYEHGLSDPLGPKQ